MLFNSRNNLLNVLIDKDQSNIIKILTALLPIFGGMTLFWFGYVSRVPREFHLLIGFQDASNIIFQVTLAIVASAFLGRVFFLLAYNFLTILWDALRTFPNLKNSPSLRIFTFYLNALRRKARKLSIYLSSTISLMLICFFVFGYIPFTFTVLIIASSISISIALRLFMFRLQRNSLISFFQIPKGASSSRILHFKLSWLTLSSLLFCVFFGIELGNQRSRSTICFEKDDTIIELSVLLATEKFFISRQLQSEGAEKYVAIPTADLSVLICQK